MRHTVSHYALARNLSDSKSFGLENSQDFVAKESADLDFIVKSKGPQNAHPWAEVRAQKKSRKFGSFFVQYLASPVYGGGLKHASGMF